MSALIFAPMYSTMRPVSNKIETLKISIFSLKIYLIQLIMYN